MKVLLQKVKNANVIVDSSIVGQIDRGLLLFVGFGLDDSEKVFDQAIDKILSLRLWYADNGKSFTDSVRDIGGGVLIVSQFTLLAKCNKGLRPDFSNALPAENANVLYDSFVAGFRQKWNKVQTGSFGEYMDVKLVNDGPITLWLDF